MNIVAARFLNGDVKPRMYEIPGFHNLNEGDIVIICFDHGVPETYGVCVCDSFNLDESPLSFITTQLGDISKNGSIVGKLNPERWE